MVFSAACEDGSLMLLPLLDQMLTGLFAQVGLTRSYFAIQSYSDPAVAILSKHRFLSIRFR